MEMNDYKKVIRKNFALFKALCVFVMMTAVSSGTKAFVSNYTFAYSAGNYTPVSGTVLFSAGYDDDSALVALPFSFLYDNVSYSSVHISTNGFISFNPLMSVYNVCGFQASPMNSIAAYGTDVQAASGASTILWAVTGVAPNRKFIVQWTDCDHYTSNGQHINHWDFQIVLNETSNVIQVKWGSASALRTMTGNTCSDAATESGNVGLLGATTTDLNIRKVSNISNTWATSVAGSVTSDICEMSTTNFPASGLTYTWTPEVPVPMTFISSTTTFVNNNAEIGQGTTNNPVIKVEVLTDGNLTPFTVSSLHLSTAGCTNASGDIATAKVFYTGYTNTFSTATQFGSTVVAPNGAYTVNGSILLSEGINYFWIEYDIKPTAALGDTVRGCCTQVTGSGTMGTQVPNTTCPAGMQIIADVGTWVPINAIAPDYNAGGLVLLSDGTVLCKTSSGGSDGYGNIYNKLTPDIHGSYINGTWSTIAPMHDTRLYYSTQVLMDGRVYVAGGEYGTGVGSGEVYNPLTNVWTMTPSTGHNYVDANSEILPDGKVLQACEWEDITFVYNPLTNSYVPGPNCLGTVDESAWVKLPDNSILYVDMSTTNSERYIPSLNQWIVDGAVPVQLYDPWGSETGGAFMLPDGRAFFIGDLGHTAYYTPSGNTTPGTWIAGPEIPDGQGTPDAAGAMMVNGKILFATSPIPTSADHFPTPTSFYEFNYLSNSFTHLKTPAGGDSETGISCYLTNMVCLPDGTVMYGEQGQQQYYVYRPGGTPVASGHPTVSNIVQTGCNTFMITGTLFNGISEGACYGDDWQSETNYPVIRLTDGTNVYYVRTYNWNSTGVQRGSAPDTTYFTIPPTLTDTSYYLTVTANGIASDSALFTYSICLGVNEVNKTIKGFSVYPNPAKGKVTVEFNSLKAEDYSINIADVTGKSIFSKNIHSSTGNNRMEVNLDNIASGIYSLELKSKDSISNVKLVVQ